MSLLGTQPYCGCPSDLLMDELLRDLVFHIRYNVIQFSQENHHLCHVLNSLRLMWEFRTDYIGQIQLRFLFFSSSQPTWSFKLLALSIIDRMSNLLSLFIKHIPTVVNDQHAQLVRLILGEDELKVLVI